MTAFANSTRRACTLLLLLTLWLTGEDIDANIKKLNVFQLKNRILEAQAELETAELELNKTTALLENLQSNTAADSPQNTPAQGTEERFRAAEARQKWNLARLELARKHLATLQNAMTEAFQNTPEAKAARELLLSRQNLRTQTTILILLKASANLQPTTISKNILDDAKRLIHEAEDDLLQKTKALQHAQTITRQMELNAQAEADALKLARQSVAKEQFDQDKKMSEILCYVQQMLREEALKKTEKPPGKP